MPTAVPITFPSRANSTTSNGESMRDGSIVVSPNIYRGSPMSYGILARSFGKNSYAMGMSPGPLSASFTEMNDFRVNGVPSSLETEAGRILRAIHSEDALNKDLMQNYSCCGLDLCDLHALLEHFEEVHVLVAESPTVGPTQTAFDPDAMDLDSGPSSSASTPPSTPPIETGNAPSPFIRRKSAYSTPINSRGVSPHPSGALVLDTTVAANTSPGQASSRGDVAFNPYASYADFSALMPGAARTPVNQSPSQTSAATFTAGDAAAPGHEAAARQEKCIPPALLFSPSQNTTPTGTPMHSRGSTPIPRISDLMSGSGPSNNGTISTATLMAISNSSGQKKSSSSKNHASGSSSGLALGGAPKPFRCPTAGCNKSYKQANGLKYHITHGQCNFMPRDPALEGLNDTEADEKARPYVCQVGSCTRRYKNMNGLRYHYQHSGQHGAVGLALLASGQHSLQTGLKAAGVELPSHVREQHASSQQQMPSPTATTPQTAFERSQAHASAQAGGFRSLASVVGGSATDSSLRQPTAQGLSTLQHNFGRTAQIRSMFNGGSPYTVTAPATGLGLGGLGLQAPMQPQPSRPAPLQPSSENFAMQI